MAKDKLYNVAKRYLEIIEQIERTLDPQQLVELEEKRVIWHNKLLSILKREGIPFKNREHVTRLAIHIVRGEE
jgi:hypothetical protein